MCPTESPPPQPFAGARTQLSALSVMLLQRRLPGDGKRWRTVLHVRLRDLVMVQRWLEMALQLDPGVEWRATDVGGLGAVTWTGSAWV